VELKFGLLRTFLPGKLFSFKLDIINLWSQTWWQTSVIPAIHEAEIRGLWSGANPLG
jgi:hypothetical protein